MYDEKAWYTSKGVWGGIIAGVALLVMIASNPVVAGVGIAGAALAIYGRLSATETIE